MLGLIYSDECFEENRERKTPYGEDRIMYGELDDDMKTVFEKLNTSPEKKLLIKNEDAIVGILCLSDIFKILYTFKEQ